MTMWDWGWKILLLAVCFAGGSTAQDLRVAFRYDRDHVLFYVGKMQDPVTFSTAELQQKKMRQPAADYASGGYLLPLTAERLQTFRPVVEEELAGGVPALGNTVTVLLGGRAKVYASAEQYVEQYGAERPARVGVLARIAAGEEKRFEKTTASAFLIAAKPKAPLPMITAERCPQCKRQMLNWFPGIGELVLEQAEKSCLVTLYRVTPAGLRPTAVSYSYGD